MSKKQGFTLIELLVVIAIIAILAAILFPVFFQAKEKSRMSVCSSNLKELSQAFIMYAQDNSDRLPLSTWNISQASRLQFPFATLPYIKNQRIWVCTIDKYPSYLPPWDYVKGTFHVSYGANNMLWGYRLVNDKLVAPSIQPPAPASGISLGAVCVPSRTWLLEDQPTQDKKVQNCSAGWPPGGATLPGTQWYWCVHMDHKQQVVSFCDGHVRSVNYWTTGVDRGIVGWIVRGNGMTSDPTTGP